MHTEKYPSATAKKRNTFLGRKYLLCAKNKTDSHTIWLTYVYCLQMNFTVHFCMEQGLGSSVSEWLPVAMGRWPCKVDTATSVWIYVWMDECRVWDLSFHDQVDYKSFTLNTIFRLTTFILFSLVHLLLFYDALNSYKFLKKSLI